jgi:hypothetical protein
LRWRQGVSLKWRQGVTLPWPEGVNLSGFSKKAYNIGFSAMLAEEYILIVLLAYQL